MQIKVDFYNNYLVDMLENIKGKIGEKLYEKDDLIVIQLDGFEVIISNAGSIYIEKEIATQDVKEEIVAAVNVYMKLRKLEPKFDFPWTVEVKIPHENKAECFDILASDGKYIEVSEVRERVYFKMTGEYFVNRK